MEGLIFIAIVIMIAFLFVIFSEQCEGWDDKYSIIYWIISLCIISGMWYAIL